MKSQKLLLLGAALVACLAFAVPTQDSRQDDARKVDVLVRALEAEKRKTNELTVRVERIEAWFTMVRAASETLDSAVNESRRNGFESAGPNPLARTQLLDGMKGFAAAISRNMPGPANALPAEGR
jgi:hypothetical protein